MEKITHDMMDRFSDLLTGLYRIVEEGGTTHVKKMAKHELLTKTPKVAQLSEDELTEEHYLELSKLAGFLYSCAYIDTSAETQRQADEKMLEYGDLVGAESMKDLEQNYKRHIIRKH